MTGPQKTLLAIALFVVLAIGGFLWFVTQWQAGQTLSSLFQTYASAQALAT
ncbi:MAG: hypothetical protein AAF218_07955 [Pseudomonadota bacterium]